MVNTKLLGELSVDSTLNNELIEAIALFKNYQSQVEDENNELVSNPESKEAFAKRMLEEHQQLLIKRAVTFYRKQNNPLQTEKDAVEADYNGKISYSKINETSKF